MIRILISVLLLCPAWVLGQPVASKATWPAADASSSPAVKSDTLRVMAYNIRVGKGMDLVNDLERTAGVIGEQRPDVVMLQEVDSVTSRTGRVDQAQELGRLTGMHAVFASAISHAGGKYGVALLSREPPLSVKRVPLPGREEARALLFVEFEEFVASSTHFSLTEEDRVESARIIILEAALCGKPLLVGGDFNAHPGTEPLEVLLREFEILSDGVSPTFPADNPDRCIDYIFGSAGVFRVVHSEVVEEPVASDHRPVVVHVVIGNNK
jgi:endonuclease/exonuclease/phosphatase family metal-dependent hydrolase